MVLSRTALSTAFMMVVGAALLVVACKDSDGPDGDEGAAVKPAGSTGSALAGGACKTAADCVSGADICNDDPGGQCTKACATDNDCTALVGSICEPGGGHCYHKCTTNADCTRAGYACVGGEGDHKWCDPKHAAGDSCTSAADCADGLNVCNDDPGGQCTKNCTKPSDCADAEGSVCETDRSPDPGHCYHECKTKADCTRDGYDCLGGPNPEGKKWCDVIPAADAGKD